MPYNSNQGDDGQKKGPWGQSGGKSSGDNGKRPSPWGQGSGNNGNKPTGPRPVSGGGRKEEDIEKFIKEGQERLRALFGGNGNNGDKGGGSGGGGRNRPSGKLIASGLVVAGLAFWGYQSFFTVDNNSEAVILRLGEYETTKGPGLNFVAWPLYTREMLEVTSERTESIGTVATGDEGLVLTSDENIVDVDFEVVWNIKNSENFLFNLAEPRETVRAVAESAMREVIGRSRLAPILNQGREQLANEVAALTQETLDSYDSGVNVLRLNLQKVEPPAEVNPAFLEVQAAEQERDQKTQVAQAQSNRILADARGDQARILEEAEGYRARVVNEAAGEASRFLSVLEQYAIAPDVTRRRLYLETIEGVLGQTNKVIIEGDSGEGVVPYLPLDQLRKGSQQ